MGVVTVLLWFILVLLSSLWILCRLVFLRDPARKIPHGTKVACPADGQVAAILDISQKEWTTISKGRWGKIRTLCKDVPDAKHLILIVMNVWHVHINRAPIQGRIIKLKHNPGRFNNAVKGPESFATIENENLEIVYKSPSITAKTVQIAGLLARRIVPYVKKDELVLKGQRIGIIKLGSQVALILPEKVKLKVKEGDHVFAGETVIGSW